MTEIKLNTTEARMTLWAVRSHCGLELRGWKEVSTILNGIAEVQRAFCARPSPFLLPTKRKELWRRIDLCGNKLFTSAKSGSILSLPKPKLPKSV